MTPSLAEYADVFVALADPNRHSVLERLVLAGEGTATTLALDLPFCRQAVVKHLAHLERAQLVQSQRRGREMRYRIKPERLAAAARGIDVIATGWDQKLASLKRLAEATEPSDD